MRHQAYCTAPQKWIGENLASSSFWGWYQQGNRNVIFPWWRGWNLYCTWSAEFLSNVRLWFPFSCECCSFYDVLSVTEAREKSSCVCVLWGEVEREGDVKARYGSCLVRPYPRWVRAILSPSFRFTSELDSSFVYLIFPLLPTGERGQGLRWAEVVLNHTSHGTGYCYLLFGGYHFGQVNKLVVKP